MKAIIDSKLTLCNPTTEIRQKIIAELTMKNPTYSRLKAMGIPTYGTPDYIKLYKRDDLNFVLPRGYAAKLDLDDFDTEDNTAVLSKVNFNSNIILRDYQEAAVTALVKNKCGVADRKSTRLNSSH